MLEARIRLRMSQVDAHYGGNLVSGARILSLFGDVATEILIRNDGDEGLFVAYDMVQFIAPVYAGDYVEVVGQLDKIGNTSRRISFKAFKVIASHRDLDRPYTAHVLESPLLVASASGTCVDPKNR